MFAAAAKFTGSGGAIVVLCPEGSDHSARLQELCSKQGLVMVKLNVGPAVQQINL